MARFNEIRIEKNVSVRLPGRSQKTTETIVHVGSGCLFDELYREVIPNGVNIVGGSSIGGVGVAGWLLGGGFSLKTNQHGLGIDNVLGFEIVLPKGGSKRVTTESVGEDKDLFEAVKVSHTMLPLDAMKNPDRLPREEEAILVLSPSLPSLPIVKQGLFT